MEQIIIEDYISSAEPVGSRTIARKYDLGLSPATIRNEPDGSLVAMVHCNNCTSDLNAWINIFKEYPELMGIPVDMDEIYGKLYNHALTCLLYTSRCV